MRAGGVRTVGAPAGRGGGADGLVACGGMRIEQDGELTVALAAPVGDVLDVLADPLEIQGFVAPLLHPRSTRDRWVIEPVRVGPVVVRPVTRVRVERRADVVAVRGVPEERATPTWLDVVMAGKDLGARSRLDVAWRVQVGLRGPQVVARLARPLLAAEADRVTHDLSARLVARFAGAGHDGDTGTRHADGSSSTARDPADRTADDPRSAAP